MTFEFDRTTHFWNLNVGIMFRQDGKLINNVPFKLDTGARITTIPCHFLLNNGMTENGLRQTTKTYITVADGKRVPNCFIVRVAEIHILGKIFRNFEVATSLSANFGYLLGQNILECFDWELNYSSGLATANFRENFIPQAVSKHSKKVDNVEQAH